MIPKHIYQIYISNDDISDDIRKNTDNILSKCPGWEYTMFRENDIVDFIERNYGIDYLKTYNSINCSYPAARADFFRYLLMYEMGGLYLDLRAGLTKNIDDIIQPSTEYVLLHWGDNMEGGFMRRGRWRSRPMTSSVIPGSPHGEFIQGIIVSTPKHVFLKAVIDSVELNIKQYEIGTAGRAAVLNTTGPVAYTKSIINYIQEKGESLTGIDTYTSYIKAGFKVRAIPQTRQIFSANHYSEIQEPLINKK